MSYTEYKDMFENAQENGIYHMFIFDIVNSRSYGNELQYIEETSRLLILNVYNLIQRLEKECDIKILHHIDLNDIRSCIDSEPFQFGDLFGFTIIRNSIDKTVIYNFFEEEKKKLNIYWDFHIMDGYYETDKYNLGGQKYYRGYCLQQLDENSKKQASKNCKK